MHNVCILSLSLYLSHTLLGGEALQLCSKTITRYNMPVSREGWLAMERLGMPNYGEKTPQLDHGSTCGYLKDTIICV